MLAFIKAIHGNVSAAGKYFMEGVVIPVEEDIHKHEEVIKMAALGYIKIFKNEAAAVAHKFRTLSERALAGESVTVPLLEDKTKAEAEKLAAEAKVEADRLKTEAETEAARLKSEAEAATAKAAQEAADKLKADTEAQAKAKGSSDTSSETK